MTVAHRSDWLQEFALGDRTPPSFFRNAASVEASTVPAPQANHLRHAFEVLQLDGILCQGNAPIVYFKQVDRLAPAQVAEIHRLFWNLGISPLLVLIDPQDVHVYSGLASPAKEGDDPAADHRLVTRLRRVVDAVQIQQLALAIESGEIYRTKPASFNPKGRVDRQLLKNLTATRDAMAATHSKELSPRAIDNLLCRVVFTCYLFDREIIGQPYLKAAGLHGAESLRDLLATSRDTAVRRLYRLFEELGDDFNGDLFSDDLAAEARAVSADHLQILQWFLSGADVVTGQGAFWPYDFSVIPIETISAIYENFLRATDPDGKKSVGAFYTPRFLAEIALDMALEGGAGSLLEKRYCDPACGSGVFLVGLFNRLAREWSRRHPDADYTQRADGLLQILKQNLFGCDQSATACRIAAFSLYLALLGQLDPPQIQALQKKKRLLPRLVADPSDRNAGSTIHCGDFFELPVGPRFDVAVGNPPWGSLTGPPAAAERWASDRALPLANRQIALAFIWKTADHLAEGGRACFVLPNGVLFNHQAKALEFQQEWLKRDAIDVVLNLSDFQRFLFEDARYPAIVIRYRPGKGGTKGHRISYLAPKTDWAVSSAEVVVVAPEDRSELSSDRVIADLQNASAPLPWKLLFWGTPRDQKLIERLSLLPRLADITSRPLDKSPKRWIAAQGFQPEHGGRRPNSKQRPWPSTELQLEASRPGFDLVAIESDALPVGNQFSWLRRLPADDIFRPPHVLVTKSLRATYCDFSVVFRHAFQGIHGPRKDKRLLQFLSAYLCSPLARFFLFHTTSSWGVNRAEVHLDELMTLPLPLPDQTANASRSAEIVHEVGSLMDETRARAGQPFVDRGDLVRTTQARLNALIYEYFDVVDVERVLVEDTNAVIIPSTRPDRASRKAALTLRVPSTNARATYVDLLCSTLNGWASGGRIRVAGRSFVSSWGGVGAIELRKVAGQSDVGVRSSQDGDDRKLLAILARLRALHGTQLGSVELLRGLKVFDRDHVYLFKPLQLRFWTRTAALNDSDSIAAAILTAPSRSAS